MPETKEMGVQGRFSMVIALFIVFSLIISDRAADTAKAWIDTVFIALAPPHYLTAPASPPSTQKTAPTAAEKPLCPPTTVNEDWTPTVISSFIVGILQVLVALLATWVSYLAIRPRPPPSV